MTFRYRGPTYGHFEITSLPGQCQVAVTHSFTVPVAHRKFGQGKLLKAAQNRMLADLEYDYAICTVAAHNAAQKKILVESGWEKLTEFHNTRQNEVTEIWGHFVSPGDETPEST